MNTPITTDNNYTINENQILQTAKQVIATEQQAIIRLLDSINNDFIKATKLLIDCKARIVVTGIGKSGHIGNKIAASFASLGSPAFFLHAAEAQHGDIGMITKDDVIIALSYSGTTNEIINLIPSLKAINAPIISITGNPESTLAKAATIHLPIYIDKEACHLNLAPSASTTATLALGDALAIAVTKAKQFTEEDFARSHPGGNLGRQLLLKVSDIMVTDNNLAVVQANTKLTEALITMTSKSLGMLAIIDQNNTILGIFTDGDLRRLFNQNSSSNSKLNIKELSELNIQDVMNSQCITVKANTLAASAWQIIRDHKINGLLVTDGDNKLIGMLNIHTLTNAKII
jgi:arabinose-5-phosphate isomerase